MFDDGQHDDDEDELRREEHLDEQALHDRGAAAQSGGDPEIPGEQHADDTSCREPAGDLGDEERNTSEDGDSAHQAEG